MAFHIEEAFLGGSFLNQSLLTSIFTHYTSPVHFYIYSMESQTSIIIIIIVIIIK